MKIAFCIFVSFYLSSCNFLPAKVTRTTTDKIPAKPIARATWAIQMDQRLQQIQKNLKDGILGVHITDPQTGQQSGLNQEQVWYLASSVKVPVAIEVLKQIEAGKFDLHTQIKLKAEDKRDGSGEVSYLNVGQLVTVKYLLEQMLIHSDNAATDILIGLVGIGNINNTLKELVPKGFYPITSLLDVRRDAYSELHPLARRLDQQDFINIKATKTYPNRYREFSRLTRISPRYLRYKTIEEAFESYYRKKLNSGSLVAFSELLLKIHKREAVSEYVSNELFDLMARCETGKKRIRAGIPANLKFAHKTGTQIGRLCDFGILELPGSKALTVAACVKKWRSMANAEKALAEVGAAIMKSFKPQVLKTSGN